MNDTKKLSTMSAALANPRGEEREMDSNQSKIPIATNVITPEIRCRMDAIAEIGKWTVCKSKLTGLDFLSFTGLLTQLLRAFIVINQILVGNRQKLTFN